MFFKKNKPAPQPEAQKMPSLQPSAPEGHSLFAPTINPMSSAIDFGFGSVQETYHEHNTYPTSVEAEPLPPHTQTEPLAWEQSLYSSAAPLEVAPLEPSFESQPAPWEAPPMPMFSTEETPIASAQAAPQALPAFSPELSPEQAWEALTPGLPAQPMEFTPEFTQEFTPQLSEAFSAETWETAPTAQIFPQPEAAQPYLGETFENYSSENYTPQQATYTEEPPAWPQPEPLQALWETSSDVPSTEPQDFFNSLALEPTTDDLGYEFANPLPPANADAFSSDALQIGEPLFQPTAPETTDNFTQANPLDFDAFANLPLPQPEILPQDNFSAASQEPFLFSEPAMNPTEELLWNNLSTSEAVPGEQVPLDPAAFLDSINQQLYPADPFQSVHPELSESEQAFEEAAQFLFPETMAAPLNWAGEDDPQADPFFPNPTLENTELGAFEEPAPIELGSSFQTEGVNLNELSSLSPEKPQPAHSLEPPITDLSQFQVSPEFPPDSPSGYEAMGNELFTPAENELEQSFNMAASHFQEAESLSFLNDGPLAESENISFFEESASVLPSMPETIDNFNNSATNATFQAYPETTSLDFSDDDTPAYDFSSYSHGPIETEQTDITAESGYSAPVHPYAEPFEEAPEESGSIGWPSPEESSFPGFDENSFAAQPAEGEAVPAYDLSSITAPILPEPNSAIFASPNTPLPDDSATETLFEAPYGLFSETEVEEVAIGQMPTASLEPAPLDYTPQDTWFGEENTLIAAEEESHAFSGITTNLESLDVSTAISHGPAFESSDDDFYATSFTLNEQGELVPADVPAQAASYNSMHYASESTPMASGIAPAAPTWEEADIAQPQLPENQEFQASFYQEPPTLEPFEEEASPERIDVAPDFSAAPEPVAAESAFFEPALQQPNFEPEEWQPSPTFEAEPLQETSISAPQFEPAASTTSQWENSPLEPETPQPQPKPAAQSASFFQPEPMPSPLGAVVTPFIAAQAAAAESPQPPKAQSKPAAAPNQQQYKDDLEAEWHSPPVEIKPKSPTQKVPSASVASELMLGNLEVLSICPLTAEKRLLVVHNKGIFALMGQYGMEQPQISVLKVFEHNPIAYQNTFTAVEEGQAASQGMYVVQVGTWHAIISTFQDKITLHTELG